MAKRRRQTTKIPKNLIECDILRLGHDGRGIAKQEGKTQFVEGALPGEKVKARYVTQRSKFDELNTVEILTASTERVTPPCEHADVCGGCSLQYMSVAAQISYKQGVLKEQLKHFGNLTSSDWAEPIVGESEGYRTKARLGVVYVGVRDEVIIGFREKRNKFITNIEHCVVLDPRAGNSLSDLRALIASLSIRQHIPQLEVAMGDQGAALVIRHMTALTDDDVVKLKTFGEKFNFEMYLQPSDASSVHKVWPENTNDRLYFTLSFPRYSSSERKSSGYGGRSHKELTLAFHPTDFTQVNSGINRKMIDRALEWLDIQSTDRVLDLFCGLGNFTLPIACLAKEVIGVEGSDMMVLRGRENAKLNDLGNVSFCVANLQADFTKAAWAKKGFDKILIDPPRSGALDVVNHISKFKAQRIVYVSCNPATLARDSGILLEKGYKLVNAGVMDMFPHTSHVESVALFQKDAEKRSANG
ncbi:MAG: 23S rRNA (uracil1939-C5)-methyltransferase [Oleiphilaceae bacterium]|jgi:23S rRNA (uracil1939-C5)-methyltransferase